MNWPTQYPQQVFFSDIRDSERYEANVLKIKTKAVQFLIFFNSRRIELEKLAQLFQVAILLHFDCEYKQLAHSSGIVVR